MKNTGKKGHLKLIHARLRTIKTPRFILSLVAYIQSRSAAQWCELVCNQFLRVRERVTEKGEVAFIGGAIGGILFVVMFRFILNVFAILLALAAIWLLIADLGTARRK